MWARCALIRRHMRIFAGVVVLVLYVLHQDLWFWTAARPLVFGFVPVGLFYHVIYVLATSVVLWFLVTFCWPKHLDE